MKINVYFLTILFTFLCFNSSSAQTESDALMMEKRNLCGGIVVGESSWDHYWEGTLYRNNLNIGTFHSKYAMVMANYGITSKLNVLVNLPYISNSSTAGTLRGLSGVQDLSLTAKAEVFGKAYKYGYFSVLTLASYTTPLTNYVADYLPYSIGNQSKTISGKLMFDFQKKKFFTTMSAQYMHRGNVMIDREAYYTTEMIYSREVNMPAVMNYQVRMGYRKNADFYIEGIFDRMVSLGGFDIRRNDMPFLSNQMEASRIGFNFKLPVIKVNGLSWVGQFNTTVAGRNSGQATSIQTGLVYQGEFTKKSTSTK